MKLISLLLFGITLLHAEHDYKDRTECQYLEDFEGDPRDSCTLLDDNMNFVKDLGLARNVIGNCPVENEPKSIILIRDDQSWVFTTRTPKSAFTAMIKFLRTQSEEVNNDHQLHITYKYKTRMGTRTLIVKEDMDLYAAILLQKSHHATELFVKMETTYPTQVPTTSTPTAIPTTAAPTTALNSNILSASEDAPWINSMLHRLRLKMRQEPCYRHTDANKISKAGSAEFRKNCGYGKGGFVMAIKTTNDHVFGSFVDLNWTNDGGKNFYCPECFLILLNMYVSADNKKRLYPYHPSYLAYATYHHSSYGPCFGYSTFDLCINSPGSSASGYAGIGTNYQVFPSPTGKSGYYFDKSGSTSFSISEWEVFPAVPHKDDDFYTRIINSERDRHWLQSLLPYGKKMGQRCYSVRYGLGRTTKATSYFRNSCGAQGPIMVIMQDYKSDREENYVFGGYSGVTWSKSATTYFPSEEAFLWILNDRKYKKQKLEQQYSEHTSKNDAKATYQHTSYGPCFGEGHDLCISSPSTPSGYAKVGFNYGGPLMEDGKTREKYPYYLTNAGSQSFTLLDWEVHIVVDDF